MRVKNTTKHSTRTIRSILTKVHNHIARVEGRMPNWERLKVRIGHTVKGGYSGWAFTDARRHGTRQWFNRDRQDVWHPTNRECPDVNLRIPRQGATAHGLAKLAYHEFMHAYGYDHKQFNELPDAELNVLLPDAPL